MPARNEVEKRLNSFQRDMKRSMSHDVTVVEDINSQVHDLIILPSAVEMSMNWSSVHRTSRDIRGEVIG